MNYPVKLQGQRDYVSNHKDFINENIKNIRHQNGEIIIEHPSEVIRALTSNQSVFTARDLERFVMAHTDSQEQYLKAYEAVMTSSPDMAMLFGKDKVVFSSKELVGIVDFISALHLLAATSKVEYRSHLI